jgi:lipopolysaccharide biosynthesis regulator YciM
MADAAATRLDSKGIADDLARIIEKLGNPIHPSPYSAEINLILGYLNARAGNKVAATNISENILRSEPEVTEGSVENLWMFRRRVSWQNLEKYCSSLKDALAGSDVALSIWAFCQARGGDTAKAKDFSQELFLKKESDPLIRALYAYAELKVGKHDEAESLLKNQKLGTPFEHWVLARACQANKNNTCLESEVAKLIDVTPSSPFGLTEKIKSLMDKRDKKEISKWIEVAREKAWYYQPIRQLEMTQRSL